MASSVQTFLAAAAQKAAGDLIAAVEALPERTRFFRPSDRGRSALDQAAECALLNGTVAGIIASRAYPADYSMEAYEREKADLAQDWPRTKALLQENTAKVVEAIRGVPDDALEQQIQMPWGPMTLSEIIAYPYWNMTYHLGQTNYIHSITDVA